LTATAGEVAETVSKPVVLDKLEEAETADEDAVSKAGETVSVFFSCCMFLDADFLEDDPLMSVLIREPNVLAMRVNKPPAEVILCLPVTLLVVPSLGDGIAPLITSSLSSCAGTEI
jgi:hypothetical protein